GLLLSRVCRNSPKRHRAVVLKITRRKLKRTAIADIRPDHILWIELQSHSFVVLQHQAMFEAEAVHHFPKRPILDVDRYGCPAIAALKLDRIAGLLRDRGDYLAQRFVLKFQREALRCEHQRAFQSADKNLQSAADFG